VDDCRRDRPARADLGQLGDQACTAKGVYLYEAEARSRAVLSGADEAREPEVTS
jgi:hypothetical protein